MCTVRWWSRKKLYDLATPFQRPNQGCRGDAIVERLVLSQLAHEIVNYLTCRRM